MKTKNPQQNQVKIVNAQFEKRLLHSMKQPEKINKSDDDPLYLPVIERTYTK